MTPYEIAQDNRKEKVRLITVINRIISRDKGKCLSAQDFDILYDLDIDQLYDVEREIIRQTHQLEEIKQRY